MSLTLSLNNALSGLNVNRQALAVLSQNIANANTKDYSRKIVEQGSQYVDGNGAGVLISDVTRRVDTYIQRAIQVQQGNVGKTEVLDTFADRLQVLLGKPGSADSMDAYLNTFFSSLQSLAETPDRSSFRLSAVTNGVTLAQHVGDLATEMHNLRFQAEQEIGQAVRDVNRDLRALANINTALANAYAMGRPNGELLDKRDALTKSIAQNLDINLFYRDSGAVFVYAGTGGTLLDETLYELDYLAAPSVNSLISDSALSPLQIYRLDSTGQRTGEPTILVEGGASSVIVPTLTTGRIRGLMEVRDSKLPDALEQLDMMAARLRDQVNAIHNAGIGFPGATSYTGTRLVESDTYSDWTGSIRIALLNAQGKPIPSQYPDEAVDGTGIRPLTLDLSMLDAGQGEGSGKPNVQSIIDEINRYYGTPQNKAVVGNLNNIRLASNTLSLPASPSRFNFDFDIENISTGSASLFVTNVQVFDDTNTDMTSVTSTLPGAALDPVNTYVTTSGSKTVHVNTAATHSFAEGERIYLAGPGVAVNGISSSALAGYFTISNVTSTGFDIVAAEAANADGPVGVASQQALSSYITAEPGDQLRTKGNGTITADLTANTTSEYYTIVVTVGVEDEQGNFTDATIRYQISNNQAHLFNARYGATSVTGEGELVVPGRNTPYARALLVDANGNELPKINGAYVPDQQGYLKIRTESSDYYLAIDSMDSSENGLPLNVPPLEGTGRGFAHYFELNNFFKSNEPTTTGDTVADSALNFAVEDRIKEDPNLVSTGLLEQSLRPADPSKPARYTYERMVGDNRVIQQLAALGSARIEFAAAGGLAVTTQSFSGYAGEILGYASSDATSASNNKESAEVLLSGFTERAAAVSGVNLDEELANTIIYQNAYSASARVISVTKELFDTLINAF